MAHPNYAERTLFVKTEMGRVWDFKKAKQIAALFDCSVSAVLSSFIEANRRTKEPLYPSSQTKDRVRKRDSEVCQYCGCDDAFMCVDHVIPTRFGGVGRSYNLVCCCMSCNSLKRNRTVVPLNFEVLKRENPEWAAKILAASIAEPLDKRIREVISEEIKVQQKV